MGSKARMVVALGAALLVAAAAVAGEAETVTLEGNIACAKCTLSIEGAKECQSVLVVDSKEGGDPVYYYLVTNEVSKEYGHVCMGTKGAVVTGNVEEKDGKMWLTPTAMKEPDAA
jgi:azurin